MSDGEEKGPRRPAWWSERDEQTWNSVKERILAGWSKIEQHAAKLDARLDAAAREQAVAFGHGARTAYRRITAWTAEFEKKLEEDWKAMGAVGRWEKVREPIKHGWEQATAPTDKDKQGGGKTL